MNMLTKDIQNTIPTRQKGAALVVSLVFLVIMTLIGVVSMNTSFMEYIMATNSQHTVSALANAELVIGSAEDDIEKIVTDALALEFEASDDHYYLADDVEPAKNDWTFKHASTTNGNYIIEYAGKHPIPGESSEMGAATSGSFVHLFLVSTKNEHTKGAKRNVQTVYVTNSAP